MGDFIHLKTVDSTNDYIKRNIEEFDNFTAVFSQTQTKGKGRLGRQWQSNDDNISLSVLFKNQIGEISLFPLICGLVVCEVIDEFCNTNTYIKWPNDVILNQKKLCGILCESVICANNMNVICGIGVNVNSTKDSFLKNDLTYATSLKIETGKSFDRIKLSKLIANRLIEKICLFNTEGFEKLKLEYEKKLINTKRQVKIIKHDKEIIATCIGIADDGNLLCELNSEIIKINSGEASVRGLYGYI